MPFIGRCLFAVAFIAFGVQQFLWGDFIPGRAAAWPAALPGRVPVAYASGVVFVVAGAAILAGRRSRSAAFVIALLVFGWAFLRNVQPALGDTGFGAAWTALGKGLALCGGALAVAGLPAGRDSRDESLDLLSFAGGICLGVFLVNSGVQHFLFAGFVKGLVPAWIPGGLFWTYFAGVALIAGGAGLMVPKTTRAAGLAVGLMISSWVVVLHIPRALAAATPAASRNEWTAVFEAVAFAGIAFVLTQKRRN